MSAGPQSSLTILFEAPFWIGLYERTDSGKYEVCKITFGLEPKDYEVYEFLENAAGLTLSAKPFSATRPKPICEICTASENEKPSSVPCRSVKWTSFARWTNTQVTALCSRLLAAT